MRLGKLLRNRLAFTLVELIVTIAIMAIIAAVAVPTFASVSKGRQTADYKADLTDVLWQASIITDAFNASVAAGNPAWVGGYRVDTPQGMQECLRAENNYGHLYEVVVVFNPNELPDATHYNYKDTIIVCVQFKTSQTGEVVTQDGVPTFDVATAKYAQVLGGWYVVKGKAADSVTGKWNGLSGGKPSVTFKNGGIVKW